MKSRVFFPRPRMWPRMLQFYIEIPTQHAIPWMPSPLHIWPSWPAEILIAVYLQRAVRRPLCLLQRVGSGMERSRPGKITLKFQWHNSQYQSSSSSCPEGWWWVEWERKKERLRGSKGGEGSCREIAYQYIQLVSDENIESLSGNLLSVRSHLTRRS